AALPAPSSCRAGRCRCRPARSGGSGSRAGPESRRSPWQDQARMGAPGQDRENLDAILATAEHDRTRLNSSAFGAFSLTLLGVASVVGAGIFVVTGDAAAHYAGPAVLISFVLAGIVAGRPTLGYAELASPIPAADSTYSYAFAAFGLFVGWFIGWDLLL